MPAQVGRIRREPGEEGALACDDYFLLLLSLELHLLAKQNIN